jgi:hypothetical protein
VKKHTVTYSNPNVNPFRTLPKDAPMRAGKDGQNNRSASGGYNNDRGNQNGPNGNFGGNFRGRTPGYNASRGNINNMNGGGFNRNFSGPPMGNMGGGFQSPMGGFQGNPMAGQFGGFNRGGMMGGMRGSSGGMRGGRGGMGNNMMAGMPMGGMPMGGMAGGLGGMGPMNMGQMGGAMQGMITYNSSSGCNGPSLRHGKYHCIVSGTRQPSSAAMAPVPSDSQYQSWSGSSSDQLVPLSPYGYWVSPNAQTQLQSGSKKGSRTERKAKKHGNTGAGGFQGLQPHFNPAFFQQNQAAGGDWQNPHGAKRPRPE